MALLASMVGALTHAFTVHPSSPHSLARTIFIQQTPHYPHTSRTKLYMAHRRSEPDEAEWKALLAALQMYKAAYGDLKVPARFIVPGMPPWPGTTSLSQLDSTLMIPLYVTLTMLTVVCSQKMLGT